MSKKQKRQVSISDAPRTPSAQAAVKAPSTSSTEFNPDYSYVIKYLKRIGVLAGSFFVILVALSFFLR